MTIGSDQLDAWGRRLIECAIEQCDKPRIARGWCSKHWQRWRRHGDPEGGGRHYATPEESFAARTERRGDCLIWTGALNSDGYGCIAINAVNFGAHRYAWERANGPIPDGMFIDHMCYTPACVETSHLRLATHAENLGNRSGANSNSISGIRGISREESGTYLARIDRRGSRHQERHPTKAEAVAWLEAKRDEIYGEFGGRLINPQGGAIDHRN